VTKFLTKSNNRHLQYVKAIYIVACLLKTRTGKPAETTVAREKHGKQQVTRCVLFGPRHVPSATGMHATIGELWEKIPGRKPQGAWRQDELTGGKPPVVK
jgi:hypothetical protein